MKAIMSVNMMAENVPSVINVWIVYCAVNVNGGLVVTTVTMDDISVQNVSKRVLLVTKMHVRCVFKVIVY